MRTTLTDITPPKTTSTSCHFDAWDFDFRPAETTFVGVARGTIFSADLPVLRAVRLATSLEQDVRKDTEE
jgi:hypothetical protein